MILQTIIAAILFGVHLMRTHFRPDPLTKEEVEAMLTKAAETVPDAKDWRVSIVDLMKVLRLDSGYAARVKLAAELGIPGYTGTASQNEIVHKAVMAKVAEHKIG